MATRPQKLNKAVVKRYGTSQSIDREIYEALFEYDRARTSMYCKREEISELDAKIAELENEIDSLEMKRNQAFKKLDKLFLEKQWHAPDIETVNHAMDEIVKFRKEHAAIDDNGDIVLDG